MLFYSSAKHYTDINNAAEKTVYQELLALDGIGETLAQRIVDGRPYISWDDMQERVDGLGDVKITAVKTKFVIRSKERRESAQ
jgi:DNA uptake protein ComE-like DNA-binding protein